MAGHGHGHHEQEGPITNKVIISDLLLAYPQAEAIIIKHLGPLALKLPGAKTESLEFICAMHDYHEYKVLSEINQVCRAHPPKVGHF